MNNLIIEASAGTGKTQALGTRLVELLRAGVAPQEIVALTFSRAAAGEIFERFVSLLAEGASKSGEDARLLRSVLATQHLSMIGTLDGFLMRIARAFPIEMGMIGELVIMDDYQAASERAAVSFSILRRTDARLKSAFVDAFSLALDGQNVRSFVESYREFIKVWHERIASMPDETSWGDSRRIWNCDPAFAHVSVRELACAADNVEAVFPNDEKWKAFADWVRSFRGSVAYAKGYAKKLVDSEDSFSSGTISFKFGRSRIDLSRDETLVVRDALMCVFGYVIRMKLALARGIFSMLKVFEMEYDKKVRKTGRLVFSDVPRLIASLPCEVRAALEYRTDSRIQAWAIDEFQDTSREQWNAIVNLLEEAKQSNGEKSVFIVGDGKQAIYGWRNGDVGIFRRERDSEAYDHKELNVTYRSGPAIVEAVNRIFARGRILSEFPAWKSPEHKTAKPDMPGFVRTMTAPGRSKEDFVEPVRAALAAVVGEKSDDPRRRGVSAAVLVRKNDLGRLLAARLKASGFEGVVWEGESGILDTPVLSGFLDLVQLADHPGDVMAYRHFKMTPLASAKYPGGVPDAAVISSEMSLAFTTRGLVRTLRALRALLPEDPKMAWSEFSEERFTEMLHAAAEFEIVSSPGTRISDFCGFLGMRRKRTVAEDGKIRIITIHRSKGLGFDYVVLPLYEHESLTVEPKGPLVGDGWILPSIDRRAIRAVGGLGDAYRIRQDRSEQEALCMYYVAMTRAKKGMTIILHPEAAASSSVRFSDLVRSASLEDLCHAEITSLCDADRFLDGGSPPVRWTMSPPPRKRRECMVRRLPSKGYRVGMSAGELFSSHGERNTALVRGTAAHAAMEKVEFSDRLPRPDGFVELWREKPFELFADGEWISGQIDRVTFFRREGEIFAEIIDFKSSLRNPERYESQLAAYKKAVSMLTGIPSSRITARLALAR